jgi:hypothetical protein
VLCMCEWVWMTCGLREWRERQQAKLPNVIGVIGLLDRPM